MKKAKDFTSWRSWHFWRDLVIYFVVFSLIGHGIEIVITGGLWLITGDGPTYGIFDNLLEPYSIYGSAVVIFILFATFLPRNFLRTRNVLPIFILTGLACAVLEYACGAFMVWRFGQNPYWDYHDQPFNLQGQICLRNTLFFGLIATVFILWLYPRLEKILHKLSSARLDILMIFLVVAFVILSVK